MTENLSFSAEELFEEIVERGRNEGVNTEEGYNDLVDEVIEEHRRVGEYHDDQNLEGYKEQLRGRVSEFMDEIA